MNKIYLKKINLYSYILFKVIKVKYIKKILDQLDQ